MTGCDLTRRAQTALRLARESSAQLGHGYVGSEHLLLGLLEERRGAAARAFRPPVFRKAPSGRPSPDW